MSVKDLRDFSTYIKNFGLLNETQDIESNPFLTRSNESMTTKQDFNPVPKQRQRQTWDLDSSRNQFEFYNIENEMHSTKSSDATPARLLPRPIGFNIEIETNKQKNIKTDQSLIRPPIRSDTFVVEDKTEHKEPDDSTNSLNINELYNMRPKPRTKTPMTFNIMLDEPNNFLFNDENINVNVPSTPSIDYGSKVRAKLIIGKQGRDQAEFIWPIDVSINQFNNQILVADSGNSRIQVFESNGKFVKSFGSHGAANGQFNNVSGLFIDSMFNVFVVDRLNHRKL